MTRKTSRYDACRSFDAGPDGVVPFLGRRPREIGPAEGVIQHGVREHERMDALARHYYNDERLWWRILDANPEFLCGFDLIDVEGRSPDPGAGDGMLGKPIRVPRAREI